MAKIINQSDLYKMLDNAYKSRKNRDLSKELFDELISISLSFDKRDIEFALFEIEYLNFEIDIGIEKINIILNSIQKLLNIFLNRTQKYLLLNSVLTIALNEKANK